MAILESCVERATALAAACGWLAFGGGAEAIVGVTVGAAGLATLVSEVSRRHGPESAAALSAIRKRVRTDLESFADVERWDAKADIRAADLAMQRGLVGCFLDRRELAASARSVEGFPGAATILILEKLGAREPGTFGPSGAEAGKSFAKTVIETALKAAIENHAYFTELQPHLLIEALQGIGTIEAKIDDVLQIVEDTHALLLEMNRRASELSSSGSDAEPGKTNSDPLATMPEIGDSEFYENIKTLLGYLYINESYGTYIHN